MERAFILKFPRPLEFLASTKHKNGRRIRHSWTSTRTKLDKICRRTYQRIRKMRLQLEPQIKLEIIEPDKHPVESSILSDNCIPQHTPLLPISPEFILPDQATTQIDLPRDACSRQQTTRILHNTSVGDWVKSSTNSNVKPDLPQCQLPLNSYESYHKVSKHTGNSKSTTVDGNSSTKAHSSSSHSKESLPPPHALLQHKIKVEDDLEIVEEDHCDISSLITKKGPSKAKLTCDLEPSCSTVTTAQPMTNWDSAKPGAETFFENVKKIETPESKFLKYLADPDFHFFMSLVPSMKQLSQADNLKARIRMQRMLYDMTYGSMEANSYSD